MAEMKMVSKLSVKTGGVSPKKIHSLPDNETTLKLCVIKGIADGVKQVEDPVHGKVFFPLTGRFQATNAQTGDVTRSGILYLPSGIHETYEAGVRKLEEGDSLQFVLELRAVKADNPAGYSYEAVDLMPPSEVDPLDQIGKQLETKQAVAALPEPVAATKVETKQPATVQSVQTHATSYQAGKQATKK